MGIKKILESVSSFTELKPLACKAKVHVSFWGTRYITVLGYEGTLPIDALAGKVLELVKKNPHFDETERECGKAIVYPIDMLYRNSDRMAKIRNCFTRLLLFLRLLPIKIKPRRTDIPWRWRECDSPWYTFDYTDGYYKVFYYYTRKQYEIAYREPLGWSGGHKRLNGLDDNYWSGKGYKYSWPESLGIGLEKINDSF